MPDRDCDGKGAYAFDGLALGNYRVRQVLMSGFAPASPAHGFRDVSLVEGQAALDAFFADHKPVSITGQVYDDRNGDGVLNRDEAPFSRRRVYLDANNNGVSDPGEPRTSTVSCGAPRISDNRLAVMCDNPLD